ncbi:MAG TPA: flagellar biosynthesis protein FlhF [Spirochaetota bacterium]|nr:flagellar biosynthesis protein FlhF [Spirochaetota bacterium]HPU88773.1 flagellar biosynthesis protein FlhF [Spirochaetota bacterium]
MRYVKIKAKNYNEAMMKLKMEYGDEAIPISHKYVKEGGLFNTALMAKDLVELTAAIQESKPARGLGVKPEKKSHIDFTVGDTTETKPLSSVAPPKAAVDNGPLMDALNGLYDRGMAKTETKSASVGALQDTIRKAAAVAEPRVASAGSDSIAKLEKEFQDLKNMLNRVIETKGAAAEKSAADTAEDDRTMRPVLEILRNNDFDHDECTLMVEEIKNNVSREDLKDRYKIEKTLRELLKNRIVTSGPITTGNRKKVIMFFGPTGVGKTTTMAKLGAIHALREGHRVTFITIDTYRIAATEQLKKYAEIMKIPLRVVSDQSGLKEVLDKEKAEIIMIDTSGRSHKNLMKISEIKSFADVVEYDFEKVLCVSANTKKHDIAEVFKAFNSINFDSVIITKVDETGYIGSVVDVADRFKKPIAYYTFGQEVPNDIAIAESERMVDLMFGNAHN